MNTEQIVELLNLYFQKYSTINEDVYQSCAERLLTLLERNPKVTREELVLEIRREIVRMEVARYRHGMRFSNIIFECGEDEAIAPRIGISESAINEIVDTSTEFSDTYKELASLKFDGRIGVIYELLKIGYSKKEIASSICVSEALVGYYILNKLAPLIIQSSVINSKDIFKNKKHG